MDKDNELFEKQRTEALEWIGIDYVTGDFAFAEQIKSGAHGTRDGMLIGACDVCQMPYAKGKTLILRVRFAFICPQCAMRFVRDLLEVELPSEKEIGRCSRGDLIAIIDRLR